MRDGGAAVQERGLHLAPCNPLKPICSLMFEISALSIRLAPSIIRDIITIVETMPKGGPAEGIWRPDFATRWKLR